MKELKVTATENQVRVLTSDNQLLCAFQGPMARIAAATFIFEMKKNRLRPIAELSQYMELK